MKMREGTDSGTIYQELLRDFRTHVSRSEPFMEHLYTNDKGKGIRDEERSSRKMW